ncbi:SDR family oxidoreductase [Chryseobacterium sp. WG14]|uniref:SDR family oxidoreductase n=1 Tax=Chryseobacterium sp. WG14 TaxID=2926909 RepID=UPI00211EE7E4|nr:SDR family oxidoreductase [Chryseobacterium sp. WG14]MCQ9641285.1 SDR family oxidoreductase [Chryseobacterium sp. WG14]
MKITVIGGTGLIGSKLVNSLRNLGHDVLAASPNSGVNTITGEGLDQALENVDVVVDVANSPSFADDDVMKFFKISGTNLIAAEKDAGIKHHIALSVVGTERLQESGYFRAKQVQEDLIKESGIPYTIVHSTQFFEFVGGIVHSSTADHKIVVSPALIQPIASDDVVKAMTDVTINSPKNSTVEIGGPEKIRLDDLVRKYTSIMKNQDEVVTSPAATYFGAPLNDSTLVPNNDAKLGSIRYDEWIANPENQR